MNRPDFNFRDHIKPLIIADTIFSIGIVILVLIWMFGDDAGFMGGLVMREKNLMLGIGIGLTLGGGIMLLNAVTKLISASRSHSIKDHKA